MTVEIDGQNTFSFDDNQNITMAGGSPDNPCAANNCTECCHDMILNMKMHEFSTFLGPNTHAEWLPSMKRLVEEANKKETEKTKEEVGKIFYFAELKISPGSLGTRYKPLELFRETGKGPNRSVAVLINGNCHNLEQETGNCSIYEKRSGPCKNYKENWPHCVPDHIPEEP
ncbi:hypothetical protein GF389_00770 [Candidatus Dojkabacteria bacterium]|nr:hypothetical protein [Candidatus Dojkabacteria bacterium]